MNKQLRKPILQRGAVVAIAFGVALASSIAAAGGYKKNSYSDHAVVTDVQPIYRTIRVNEPRQECWSEEVYHQPQHTHNSSAGSTIVGGIIGGVIGHQVGKRVNRGRGKNGGAILGTLIGAAIGHENGAKSHTTGRGYTTVENRCQTVDSYHTEERIDGYRVSYEYNGALFHTRMKHRPGDRIRVNVQVTPSAY